MQKAAINSNGLCAEVGGSPRLRLSAGAAKTRRRLDISVGVVRE